MSDDSEVAFWTGILGQEFLSRFRSIFKSYYLYSIDVLLDPISYFIIVGKGLFFLSLP